VSSGAGDDSISRFLNADDRHFSTWTEKAILHLSSPSHSNSAHLRDETSPIPVWLTASSLSSILGESFSLRSPPNSRQYDRDLHAGHRTSKRCQISGAPEKACELTGPLMPGGFPRALRSSHPSSFGVRPRVTAGGSWPIDISIHRISASQTVTSMTVCSFDISQYLLPSEASQKRDSQIDVPGCWGWTRPVFAFSGQQQEMLHTERKSASANHRCDRRGRWRSLANSEQAK
jgi:hypothetical protein